MRGLQAAVIFMGVMIVAGVAVIGVTIVKRLNVPAPSAVALVLDEPAGTRMVSAAAAGDRLAVLLQGGGADRVVLVDPRTGVVAGRVALAH
jgi:hypothetical protein